MTQPVMPSHQTPDTAPRSTVEALAQVGVLLTILLWMVVDIHAAKGLFADGTGFLVTLLKDQGFVDFDKPRIFVQWLTQFPVVWALKQGVTDLHTLITLHSLGLCAPPTLLWLTALYRSRRTDLFWPLTLLFSVVALNTGFFIIGEYNSAYAAVALAMSLLLAPSALRPLAWLLLLSCAVLLLRAYESLLYLAPMLAAAAFLRWRATPSSSRVERAVIAIAGLLFLASSATAVYSILVTRGTTSAAHSTGLKMIYKNPQFTISVLTCWLYLLWTAHQGRFAQALKATAIGLSLLLFIPLLWSRPEYHYSSRTLAGLFLLASFSGLLAHRWGLIPRPLQAWLHPYEQGQHLPRTAASWLLPTLVFSALMASSLHMSWGFPAFIQSMQRYVNSHTGLVPLETAQAELVQAERYGWPWIYPSLSLLLRQSAQGALILNGTDVQGWQPFDPRHDDHYRLPPQYHLQPLN